MGLFNKDKENNASTEDAQNEKKHSGRGSVISSASLLKREAVVTKKDSDNIPQTVTDAKFSDLYITPDKKCYVWSGKSNSGLKVANYIDLHEFMNEVVSKYDGSMSSYSLKYKDRYYRVERTIALEGEQFCVRKMPISIPDLEKLGLPRGVFNQLMQLRNRTGLILLTGATGVGKSTTIASLIKKYLTTEGGYAFTIEDPIEMPLDGVYKTERGDLGLCKQTVPPDGRWDEGIKSALRSKPHYIYVGEIRSPEAAVELLRASASGHLVFSTIHGNNVTDAINSLGKYAASSGITEEMAYELIANGFLGCIYQNLVGAPKRLIVESVFANPSLTMGCQVRSMIRSGRLNLGTIIEQQKSRMDLNLPIFENQ
jgi:twitching motility protein PilT